MNTCCPPNLSGIRWYRSLLSIFRRNRVRPHVPSDSEWLSWALRYKNNKYSIILYKYSSYVYNTLQSFTTWTYCVKLPRAVTTMRILSKLFRESILILAFKDESAEAHVYFSPCFSLPLTGDIRIPRVNNCNMFAL